MRAAQAIGLFGRSCSGKTTLARALAESIGAATRHCGDVLRYRARSLGVTVPELTDAEHKLVDEETRAVAASGQLVILDGSFLDVVLRDVEVTLVRIDCSEDVRAQRFLARSSQSQMPLQSRDASDDTLRLRLYRDLAPKPPMMILDSSSATIAESLQSLRAYLHDAV